MNSHHCNILIIGAGITGLTVARELLLNGIEDICLLEKESRLGAHASGRNSGVLHAGIYYTPDTLKAQYCVQGNHYMKDYCRAKGLKLVENGKVIVAKDLEEIEQLYVLKDRADKSGARASIIDEKKLSQIEAYARTCEKALYVPETAVIDPLQILHSLLDELQQSQKAHILFNSVFQRIEGTNTALTSSGKIHFNKLINAAGCFADRIAHQCGLGKEYLILPFKGSYRKLSPEGAFLVKGNIYPVPDLRNPFLGVHLTHDVNDNVYAGPTATPIFGRENYSIWCGYDKDTPSILFRDIILFLQNPLFRNLALSEIKKYSKKHVVRELQKLVPQIKAGDIENVEKSGIRPQLVHWPSKKLATDYLVLQNETSLHILNAISPAFTSSMAFAKYIVSLL